MQFELKNPLSEAHWQAVEQAALKILANTGLKVAHAAVLESLAGRQGLHVSGSLVRFEPALVLEQVRGVRGTEDYDTHLMSGAYSHNYMDPFTGVTRPATLADLVTSVRQAEALGGGVCAPVVPMDVAGPRQELIMERVTHENCRYSYGGGQATSVLAAEAGIEMSAVVGRPHELEIWITSPLNLDPGGLDILWQLRQRRPRVRVANMPVRGMSGPISLAGMLAQTVAECLGAVTILRLLDICSSVAYRTDAFWMYAADMQTANVLINGPDYTRLLLLSLFLAKRYGIDKPMGKALLTSSKQPDAQAAADKAAQAMAAALAGVGTFTAAGALSIAEIFSPLQMVLDHEIMSWVDAAVRPLDFSEDDFLLDVIAAVGPDGTFLAEETTAARARDVTWRPALFSCTTYPAWVAEGGRTLISRARDRLAALQVAQGPIVSEAQRQELEAIERKFAARL
jgi:trimethylamine:corrinoid methyltransferase-like protein